MTDIVPKSWLTDRSDDVRIVDVRDSWEYDGIGHLPGAVNIPFDAFRAEESGAADDGMLPGEDVFADLLSEAGIDSDDDIVAYDDTHGVFAARFLVTAELYGHDPANLHLLDGDFSAWQLQYETSGEAPQLTPTEYVVDLPAETPLVDADAVSGAVDSDAVIVDCSPKTRPATCSNRGGSRPTRTSSSTVTPRGESVTPTSSSSIWATRNWPSTRGVSPTGRHRDGRWTTRTSDRRERVLENASGERSDPRWTTRTSDRRERVL